MIDDFRSLPKSRAVRAFAEKVSSPPPEGHRECDAGVNVEVKGIDVRD